MSTSKGNGETPPGYGHDRTGAAGGENKNEGRAHVTHRGPMQGGAGVGEGATSVAFTLDGRDVTGTDAETIWQVAQRHGTTVPHLRYLPEPVYRPDGNCRACMVDIEG